MSGLYLIYKGFRGYEDKPLLLAYTEKQDKAYLTSILDKNKNELIEPRIIEAGTLRTAFKIYKNKKG